jgi:serine/threonine protein kinase
MENPPTGMFAIKTILRTITRNNPNPNQPSGEKNDII